MEKKKIKNFLFWKNKKILITGHTGFKGSWLIIILRTFGARIFGIALKPEKDSLFKRASLKNEIEKSYILNIKNFNKLNEIIDKHRPEIIFHLASQALVSESYKDPYKTFETNFIGTLNVLEILKKKKFIKSVIFVTSDKVYKINPKKIQTFKEHDELGGDDPYSASKVGQEILVNSFVKSFFNNMYLKNRVSTVRSGNVIGGGDNSKNRLVPDILRSLNKNKILNLRNPEHVRPWQHVIEPLYGYIILAQKQYENVSKNLPTNWNFGPNMNNFVKVEKIVSLSKKITKNLKINIVKKSNISFKETKILKLDNKLSKKHLGWQPKWNIYKTLDKVFEWNKLNKKNISLLKICKNQIQEYFK